jgi:hypothetical protein
MSVASKPMSDISCRERESRTEGKRGGWHDTHINNLLSVPLLGVKLDYPAFSQKGDLYRVDSGLRPEHSLDRL